MLGRTTTMTPESSDPRFGTSAEPIVPGPARDNEEITTSEYPAGEPLGEDVRDRAQREDRDDRRRGRTDLARHGPVVRIRVGVFRGVPRLPFSIRPAGLLRP